MTDAPSQNSKISWFTVPLLFDATIRKAHLLFITSVTDPQRKPPFSLLQWNKQRRCFKCWWCRLSDITSFIWANCSVRITKLQIKSDSLGNICSDTQQTGVQMLSVKLWFKCFSLWVLGSFSLYMQLTNRWQESSISSLVYFHHFKPEQRDTQVQISTRFVHL